MADSIPDLNLSLSAPPAETQMSDTNPNLDLSLSLSPSTSAQPARDSILTEVWKSLVRGSIPLHKPHSFCFYMGEGHFSQLGSFQGRHVELNPRSTDPVPPAYLCMVTSCDLKFHRETEEPFVLYGLHPVKVWYKNSDAPETEVNEIVSQSILLQPTDLVELSVSDDVVNKIFCDRSTVQVIKANDVFGAEWSFERDNRLLKAGWKEFVQTKKLVAGDHVLFLRKGRVIFVVIRKSGPMILGHADDAKVCMEDAEEGKAFSVEYYPRKAVTFVVSADIVFESSETIWMAGLKVNKSGRDFVEGKVTKVAVREPKKGFGKLSGWNMLKVEWEGAEADMYRPWVNAWDLVIHGSRFGPLPQPQANAEKGQETQNAAGNGTRNRGDPLNIANYTAVWNFLAGKPIHLPQTDSYCFYFSEGHLEQVGIINHLSEPIPHSMTPAPPAYLCKITSRELDFHTVTEEPFVRYVLRPVEDWYSEPYVAPKDAHYLQSKSVLLTQTDLEELALPNAITTQIFRWDNSVGQIIKAVDVFGAEWKFERVLRSDRHHLIKGWKDFVHAKGLVAGDTVLFLRRINTIFVCIRKSGQFGLGDANQATEAMKAAEKGSEFSVTYYPRKAVAFVISAATVVEASQKWWLPGLQVDKVQVRIPGKYSTRGEVTNVVRRKPEKGLGTLSGWNMLQVKWEDDASMPRPWVNAWEVGNFGLQFGPLPQPQKIAAQRQKTGDAA